MKSAQHYRDKASEIERLATDPRQHADLRAELRAVARQWRQHAEQADWLTRRDEPLAQGRDGRVPYQLDPSHCLPNVAYTLAVGALPFCR
jgi:hypothetical protein